MVTGVQSQLWPVEIAISLSRYLSHYLQRSHARRLCSTFMPASDGTELSISESITMSTLKKNGTTWKPSEIKSSLKPTGCQGVMLYQHRRSPLPRMQEVQDIAHFDTFCTLLQGFNWWPLMAVDGRWWDFFWWGAWRPPWRIGGAAKFQPCHGVRGVRGGSVPKPKEGRWLNLSMWKHAGFRATTVTIISITVTYNRLITSYSQ